MGLLRKAAGAAVRAGPAASAKPAPEKKAAHAGQGLLRKTLDALGAQRSAAAAGPAAGLSPASRQLREAASPAAAAYSPPASAAASAAAPRADELVRRIIEDISALGNGVELPSRLFTALRKHLSITKGALLLYDAARLEYAPWASVGYDQTTLHRLRIALGANETFNALANGKPIIVSDEEQKKRYQPYFSSREYSLAARLLLTPFIFEETLVGVLLVTDLKAAFADDAQMLSCLEQAALAASPLVQKARGRLMQATGVRAARPAAETPEAQISRIAASPAARGKKLLCASVDLTPYARRVAAAHEDLEPFRLAEDIRYFLDCFLADQGTAIRVSPNSYVVCLQDFPRSSLDLFAHQLGLFLGSLFETETASGPAGGIEVSKSVLWPDEASDPAELLARLSSS